ncbi:hypothetical protein J6590_074670 [Homalodisca vitripennis]|nr:hypothetical protein J6590_074670 [Homalodisca vitripennis]
MQTNSAQNRYCCEAPEKFNTSCVGKVGGLEQCWLIEGLRYTRHGGGMPLFTAVVDHPPPPTIINLAQTSQNPSIFTSSPVRSSTYPYVFMTSQKRAIDSNS